MTLDNAILVLHGSRDADVRGLQAGEIVEETGMQRVTLHRLLRSLQDAGLIERDESRRYHLGRRSAAAHHVPRTGHRLQIRCLGAVSTDGPRQA